MRQASKQQAWRCSIWFFAWLCKTSVGWGEVHRVNRYTSLKKRVWVLLHHLHTTAPHRQRRNLLLVLGQRMPTHPQKKLQNVLLYFCFPKELDHENHSRFGPVSQKNGTESCTCKILQSKTELCCQRSCNMLPMIKMTRSEYTVETGIWHRQPALIFQVLTTSDTTGML